jgi:hypothetical protein
MGHSLVPDPPDRITGMMVVVTASDAPALF